MQIEPPKAELPKRKRRWFQFSLRTLLIFTAIVAIPCAYVGWQARFVRQRRAMLSAVIDSGGGYRSFLPKEGTHDFIGDVELDEPPFLRRCFGDETITNVWIRGPLEEGKRLEFERVFSDAHVTVIPPGSEMHERWKGRKTSLLEISPTEDYPQ